MYGEEEEQTPDTVELQRCWPGSWDWARQEVTETEILYCCFIAAKTDINLPTHKQRGSIPGWM